MKPLLSDPISKVLLLAVLFTLPILSAEAQLNFTLASSTATAYTFNSNDTTIIGNNQDENTSGAVNIGFNFTYGCNTYTQFTASSNGWMSLGYNTVQSVYTNDLTTTGQGPILAPLWDDLSTSSTGNVNFRVTGTAPNRVLTIEWLNMLWNYGASGPVISFQVKLHETTNVIEFIYSDGTTGVNNGSGGASIGLNGGYSATDFYSLNSSGTAPTAVYGTQTSNISTKPATNEDYTWTPNAQSYVSATTVVASTAVISKCNGLNQVMLGIQVVTSGCVTPESITQFGILMTGSTSATNDVSLIHIYYTGTSAGFAPANEFFSGGTAAAAGTILINGSQQLVAGTNYFWVAYDLKATATAGDIVKAACSRFTIAGVNKAPSVVTAQSRTIAACSVAPGGITNASFWVEGTAGTSTTTDGGTLSTWSDQSGNARNATATGNLPVFQNNSTNNINFNPVVHFTAASSNYMTMASEGVLATGDNPYEVYAVVAPTAANLTSTGKFLFAGSGLSTGGGFNGFNAFDVRTGNAFNDTWDVNDLLVNNAWTAGYPSLATFNFNSTARTIYVAGASAGSITASNRISTNNNDAIGCQIASPSNLEFYDGNIAELITYANNALGQATRNQVESYLAIKYGITLAHDYLASTGATVWSQALRTTYDNNIIGIARDDNGALSQKQSKSTSVTADMLTMYIGTKQTNQNSNTGTFAGGNLSFFMAGSNGLAALFSPTMTTDVPAGICCRLQRAWLSQKTNFTNTDLTLQFDFSAVAPGTPLFASDLRLLVDNDGVFANATVLNSPTIAITVAGNVVTVVVPASSITAAQPYFTLASAANSTPLPITIESFSAACQNRKVQVNWTMGTAESNTFAIERSSNGGDFATAGVVAGDPTGAQSSYTWTDNAPLPGVSAYRLKATDNNSNNVTYSSIAPVTACGLGANNAFVAADPSTGKSSMLVLQLQQNATVNISCYDMVGHQLELPGLTGQRSMEQGVYNLPVPQQGFAAGVYLLAVTINEIKNVYRIIQ